MQEMDFIENGVLVIPNVLFPEEVDEYRSLFHNSLLKYGVISNEIYVSYNSLK